MGRVAQSEQRLATGWTVRGSNPGGGEIFRTCPDQPWGPPSSLYNGYLIFPGVKIGRGVTLTPHPLLMPWSSKGRAIPLLLLRAVRPVQSLSACTRVTFTFFLTAYTPTVVYRYAALIENRNTKVMQVLKQYVKHNLHKFSNTQHCCQYQVTHPLRQPVFPIPEFFIYTTTTKNIGGTK